MMPSSSAVESTSDLVLPTIEEMHRTLRQSGILSKTTIFPSKQPVGGIPVNQLPQIQLANSSMAIDSTIATSSSTFDLTTIKNYLPRIIGFLLTLQSLRGIYASINFILIEFPQLEVALTSHMVTEQQINGFVSRAVVIAISTFISMIFALRLTFLETKTAKLMSTVFGIGLLAVNIIIENYFNQLNSGVLFAEYSASVLEQTVQQVEQAVGQR